MPLPGEWFSALLDSSPDVYFRYAIEPERRVAYVSRSIETLTGHPAAEFKSDAALCARLVARGERHLLRRLLRSRRALSTRLHILRDGVSVPIDLETVAVVRNRRLVAIEGVARLASGSSVSRKPQAVSQPSSSRKPQAVSRSSSSPQDFKSSSHPDPTQLRLGALLVEVHDLLHQMLPAATKAAAGESRVVRLGELALDLDRLTVTESGKPVGLTSREVLVLRYLLQRPGRVVTRQQLLTDVWNYQFTGDDRTVDVHISRLRRKLPSLRGRLVALRNIGYRLEDGAEEAEPVRRAGS